MDNRIIADIEPSILIWARERYSTTHIIVAQKTNIDKQKIIDFEKGTDQPSFAQLRKIANFFRLSITAFFLPYPPGTEEHITASLRRLSGMFVEGFSIELTRAIIDAVEKRDFYINIKAKSDLTEWPFENGIKYEPIEARELLGLEMDIQRSWRDPRLAFNYIRSLLEAIDILVFQVSRIDLSEIRACAITEFPIPVIILNRSDSYSGRTFSMIHELYHIINKQYDIEITSDKRVIPPEYIDIEQDANSFASEFLLPSKYFHIELSQNWGRSPERFIDLLSKKYSISKEFVGRRLLDEQLIDELFYYRIREEGISNSKKKSGFVPPNIDSLSKNGKLYTSAIFEEVAKGKLSRSKACNYLDVKEKWLDTIQRLI